MATFLFTDASSETATFRPGANDRRWPYLPQGRHSILPFSGDVKCAVSRAFAQIRALELTPLTLGTIYAVTGSGVFKSTDGGDSWDGVNTGLTSTRIRCLVVDPVTPTIVYAGTMDSGVFKSTNGAGNWSPTNNGLTDFDVGALAIDPMTPAIVYAGTWDGGAFRSVDAGES